MYTSTVRDKIQEIKVYHQAKKLCSRPEHKHLFHKRLPPCFWNAIWVCTHCSLYFDPFLHYILGLSLGNKDFNLPSQILFWIEVRSNAMLFTYLVLGCICWRLWDHCHAGRSSMFHPASSYWWEEVFAQNHMTHGPIHPFINRDQWSCPRVANSQSFKNWTPLGLIQSQRRQVGWSLVLQSCCERWVQWWPEFLLVWY